jgi:hypothetical protein
MVPSSLENKDNSMYVAFHFQQYLKINIDNCSPRSIFATFIKKRVPCESNRGNPQPIASPSVIQYLELYVP